MLLRLPLPYLCFQTQDARQFNAGTCQAAVDIVGNEQYILSAVMHADERNQAMSEVLGQDDFFHHMSAAGYTDVERGERGSSEEHLNMTQFKVMQAEKRLEGLTEWIEQSDMELAAVQQ